MSKIQELIKKIENQKKVVSGARQELDKLYNELSQISEHFDHVVDDLGSGIDCLDDSLCNLSELKYTLNKL